MAEPIKDRGRDIERDDGKRESVDKEGTNRDRQPRIALVSDCDLNRYILKGILSDAGYELVASLDSAKLLACFDSSLSNRTGTDSELKNDAGLDAWLVDIGDDANQQVLDLLVEKSELPLLVNDEVPPTQALEAHALWQRRLLEKLEVVAIRHCAETGAAAITHDTSDSHTSTSHTGNSHTGNSSAKPGAENVWVLAASLGGPEAVSCFLNALPPGLPLAMVYGQHIEKNFDGLLAAAIGNQQNYPLQLIRDEQTLTVGQVAVVPVDNQLRFLARGRVVETRNSWSGCYQPALDQVIAELARVYRQNLGVIIFSGMCNDGEIGCRVAKACGSTVWVQEPVSCMSPDMPNAAISTGCVSHQGTPEQLAASLAARLAFK